jgi:tetratricopeptide (TPR) repeat protein
MRNRKGLTPALAALTMLLLAAPAAAAKDAGTPIRYDEPTTMVDIHLAKGDDQIDRRNFGAARREYRAAAELTRAEGNLPAEALRRIANSFYFQGRYDSAVKTLDKLAAEAAERGDLATQAWAIVDAAWVAGKAGRKSAVEKRIARLEKLLGSQYLPADVRHKIRSERLDAYYAATRS